MQQEFPRAELLSLHAELRGLEQNPPQVKTPANARARQSCPLPAVPGRALPSEPHGAAAVAQWGAWKPVLCVRVRLL